MRSLHLVFGAHCALLGAAGCGAAGPRLEQPASVGKARPSAAAHEGGGGERMGSPIALARAGDKTLAYIADADDARLYVLDVAERRELSALELAEAPSELVVTHDGRLIVSFRNASRVQVFRVRGADGLPEAGPQVTVPTDPVGLLLSPDDQTLFVTSAWARTLSAYRATDLTPLWHATLEREPRGMVLSDDGGKLFVSHALGSRVSVVSLAQPASTPKVIPIVSTPERERNPTFGRVLKRTSTAVPVAAVAPKPRVRVGLQHFSLAKSVAPAGRVLLPGVLVDPGNREIASSGYGDTALTALANIAVLDADRAQLLPSSVDPSVPVSVSLGWGERAPQCLLPRAAVVDPKTGALLVACFGMDVVMAFDSGSADPRSARLGSWAVANHPTGIAIDAEHRQGLVWSQRERSVDFIALDDADHPQQATTRIELSRPARYHRGEVALGEALFHAVGDRRISADGRGCASCHLDGRDDGLTWSTPLGPRQTPALAGRLRGTEPFGWDGQGSDLAEHMSETFARLRGSGLSERELDALSAYIASLRLPDDAEHAGSEEHARGRTIFLSRETGCAACHFGPTFSDGQLHDVGSRTGADRTGRFNTPSLLGVGATAPYFHDGRFASLREMLVATNGRMGKTKHLSPSDFDALIAYLESL